MSKLFNLNTGEVYEDENGRFSSAPQWVDFDPKQHTEGQAGLANPNGLLVIEDPIIAGALEDATVPLSPLPIGKYDIQSGPTGSKAMANAGFAVAQQSLDITVSPEVLHQVGTVGTQAEYAEGAKASDTENASVVADPTKQSVAYVTASATGREQVTASSDEQKVAAGSAPVDEKKAADKK